MIINCKPIEFKFDYESTKFEDYLAFKCKNRINWLTVFLLVSKLVKNITH